MKTPPSPATQLELIKAAISSADASICTNNSAPKLDLGRAANEIAMTAEFKADKSSHTI